MAVSPTSTLPGSASGAAGRSDVGLTATMARSFSGARPTTRPFSSCLSAVRTVTLVGALDHVVGGEDEALAVVDDARAEALTDLDLHDGRAERLGHLLDARLRARVLRRGDGRGGRRRAGRGALGPDDPSDRADQRGDQAHSQPRPLARTGLTGAGNRRGLVGRRLLATGSRLGDQVVGIGRRQEVGHRRGGRQVPPGAPRGQHRGRVRISGRAHRHGWSPRMDGARRGARAVMAAKVRRAT